MIVIIAAVYDEVAPLLTELRFRRAAGLSVYEGTLFGRQVMLCLVGPGITKPGRLERFLREQNISLLLNVGFCGALRYGLFPGDALIVEKFSISQKPLLYHRLVSSAVFLSGLPAVHLVTVSGVVMGVEEKEDLRHLTGADVVDMEGYHLLQLAQKLGVADRFICLKIIGDAFDDSVFFRREQYFRAFFRERSLRKKILIILRTGIPASIVLYRRKKMLQRKLSSLIAMVLQNQ